LALLVLLSLWAYAPREPAPSTDASPRADVTAATAAASPAPTRRPGSWTGLLWSSPVAIPDGDVLFEVLPWRGGYVAVGQAIDDGEYVGAAFASSDGLAWERTTAPATFPADPGVLTSLGGRLVAFVRGSAPFPRTDAWTSVDGRTWRRAPELALADGVINAVASRDTTLVAAGIDASGRHAVWRSAGGGSWSRVSDIPPRALVGNVAGVAGGFVAFGRDGEPDVASGGVGVRGVGRPAAWRSSDGLAWTAVAVEGTEAPGAQLLSIYPVRDGMFAAGSDSAASPRSALLWDSPDGLRWRALGPPPHWGYAGTNGTQAVIVARAAAANSPGFEAWVSEDGREWRALDPSGDIGALPSFETGVGQPTRIEAAYVVSNGVLLIAQDGGHFHAIFGRAITAQ
jgi:hypothetical protein